MVKDRAGSGKTNLLCRAASRDDPGVLAVFLSCRFDLREPSGVEAHVLASLQAAVEQVAPPDVRRTLPRGPAAFLQALLVALEAGGMRLVVYLDGINENRDLHTLDEALLTMFQRWNAYPVRFVVTCRDIFWDFFHHAEWAPFLFEGQTFSLPEFTSVEVDAAISAYFEAFGIRGALVGAARERCRHPLLLRFFCEAYAGQNIREYEDLRLKELFDEYWERKRREVSLGLGLGSDRAVEEFVFRLVERMVHRSATQLYVGEIEEVTGERDLESKDSLYRRLLDQDIILEELPPADAFDTSYAARRVAFVYDEFYDYLAALAHVRRQRWDALAPADVAADFLVLLEESRRFEQLVGVAEYLVLIAEKKGLHRALCGVLAHLGRCELLCSVLPKLRDKRMWMADALGICLQRSSHIRFATTQSVLGAIREAPPGRLAEHVLYGVIPSVPWDADAAASLLAVEAVPLPKPDPLPREEASPVAPGPDAHVNTAELEAAGSASTASPAVETQAAETPGDDAPSAGIDVDAVGGDGIERTGEADRGPGPGAEPPPARREEPPAQQILVLGGTGLDVLHRSLSEYIASSIRDSYEGPGLIYLEPGMGAGKTLLAGKSLRFKELAPEPPVPLVGTRVAQAVWVLWGEQRDVLWELIRRWSVAWPSAGAARAVLRSGLDRGVMETDEALDVLVEWMTGEDMGSRDAAVELIPALSADDLFARSEEWSRGGESRHADALPEVMRHLFRLDPLRATDLLAHCAGKRLPHLDRAVATALGAAQLPEDRPFRYYRTLEMRLIHLRVLMGERLPGARKRIDALLAATRAIRSRRHARDLDPRRDHRSPRGEWLD